MTTANDVLQWRMVWWVLAAWHKSKCVTMIRHNPWHHLRRPSHLKSQFSKDETLLLLSQPHPHLHTLTVRKCHKSNPQSFWVELVDTRYSTFKYVVHCAFNIWFSHMLLCLDLFIKWMSSLNLKLVWINSPEQTTILGRVKIRNKNTQAHIIHLLYRCHGRGFCWMLSEQHLISRRDFIVKVKTLTQFEMSSWNHFISEHVVLLSK